MAKPRRLRFATPFSDFRRAAGGAALQHFQTRWMQRDGWACQILTCDSPNSPSASISRYDVVRAPVDSPSSCYMQSSWSAVKRIQRLHLPLSGRSHGLWCIYQRAPLFPQHDGFRTVEFTPHSKSPVGLATSNQALLSFCQPRWKCSSLPPPFHDAPLPETLPICLQIILRVPLTHLRSRIALASYPRPQGQTKQSRWAVDGTCQTCRSLA